MHCLRWFICHHITQGCIRNWKFITPSCYTNIEQISYSGYEHNRHVYTLEIILYTVVKTPNIWFRWSVPLNVLQCHLFIILLGNMDLNLLLITREVHWDMFLHVFTCNHGSHQWYFGPVERSWVDGCVQEKVTCSAVCYLLWGPRYSFHG